MEASRASLPTNDYLELVKLNILLILNIYQNSCDKKVLLPFVNIIKNNIKKQKKKLNYYSIAVKENI